MSNTTYTGNKCGSFFSSGATAISHVDVPITLIIVPGFTPEPTAPACASIFPTATEIPSFKPSLLPTLCLKTQPWFPYGKLIWISFLLRKLEMDLIDLKNLLSTNPFHSGLYKPLCPAAHRFCTICPVNRYGMKSDNSIHLLVLLNTSGEFRAQCNTLPSTIPMNTYHRTLTDTVAEYFVLIPLFLSLQL